MKTITLFTIIFFFLANLFDCQKDDEPSVLSPARNLEGIWTTTFPNDPVKFYIQTDFCSNNLQDVATQDRTITWEVEEIDDNTVFITLNFSTSNFEIVNQNCNPTGYVPDTSTAFLTGIISSSGITIYEYDNLSNELGKFTFTTDLMQGTWNDSWCSVYCQRVYTLTNEYKLTLQN